MSRFYPRYSQISNITNELQPTVTFTDEHDFTIGEIVSFRVTPPFGMSEINNQRAKVLTIPDVDEITIGIDTTTWTPFTLANLDTPGTTPPVCVPSSSGVIDNLYTPSVNIEDAFDNRR